MLVRIEKRMVDVVDKGCGARPCFSLGFDKGTYVQGRGYTSYHKDGPRAVCWTRFMAGCPVNSVCGTCRVASVRLPGEACGRHGCAGTTVAATGSPTTEIDSPAFRGMGER